MGFCVLRVKIPIHGNFTQGFTKSASVAVRMIWCFNCSYHEYSTLPNNVTTAGLSTQHIVLYYHSHGTITMLQPLSILTVACETWCWSTEALFKAPVISFDLTEWHKHVTIRLDNAGRSSLAQPGGIWGLCKCDQPWSKINWVIYGMVSGASWLFSKVPARQS